MSIWQKDQQAFLFEPLHGERKTDVTVIGGGIAGLLAAYRLAAAGVDCVVLEKKIIGGGVTRNTTAKITAQHNLIFDKLIRTVGEEKAGLYLAANEKAIQSYRELCQSIDCDFEIKDSYIYSQNNRYKLENELKAIEKLGGRAEFKENIPLPIQNCGALRMKQQAQFHPLKFLRHIARDLAIYERTEALGIENGAVITPDGKIHCKKIIVATHFPFLNRHGFYFLKMYQARSYVLVLEQAGDVDGMYIDESPDGFSFRNYQNLLLFGGGGHRTGKPGGGFAVLRGAQKEFYPRAELVEQWATQDCMTLDGLPYIGQYAKSTPNLLVATGFQKWGMTTAMVAADLLTDLILEKRNAYQELFSPQRFLMNRQFFINGAEAVRGLCNFSAKRCSHMGCALHYNRQEHSWDCACHGSRFDESGKVVDNPAKTDIGIK